MTNQVIDRAALSKQLHAFLGTTVPGVLVGRGVAPPGGGWPNGAPNTGAFVPYAVLKTGTAITPAPGEPERLSGRRASWLCRYQITSHSTKESRVEDTAQLMRNAVITFAGPLTLDTVVWVVQSVLVPQLGATERDDSTDPAGWRVTDDVSLHLSRLSPH